jgi:hypothetical protein
VNGRAKVTILLVVRVVIACDLLSSISTIGALPHCARAKAQVGNSVGVENYYQYAEHYF